ncbi:MAG: hypothetical protein J6A01_02845 [Proteobacteria bacterium]|nr:hypothetical protein [Pseudomonadota bacterium]
MTRLRIIALCAAMIGVGVTSLSACYEEKTDERIQPEIWKSVSEMYDNFGTETDCAALNTAISEKIDPKNWAKACSEYNESFKKNGSLESLTHDQTNSGFYQAAFILYDKIQDNIDHCTESVRTKRETVSNEFQKRVNDKEQCKAFIKDCKDFMTSRDI